MIKNILLILFSFLLFSCSSDSDITELNNKWLIYNEKYIKTENLENIEADGEIYFSGNNSKVKDNKAYSYGSIKQKISVVPGKNYSLYISGIFSSSKLWIDDELLGEYGTIGTSIKDSDPKIKRIVLNFIPEKEDVNIVIEFANFHFGSKYLFKWIVMGSSSEILELYTKNQSKDYFTLGLLLLSSVLFLLMYIINTKDKYNIYFSLFTFSYAIRSYLMKNTTINEFLPWFTWTLEFQFNKASEIWALLFVLLFLKELYPNEFKSKITPFFTIFALITSFLAFIPLGIFNKYNILLIMHVEILLVGSYVLMSLVNCVKNSRLLAKLALFSMSVFFISIIFDIFASRIFILYDYYSAQFVVLVVAVMFLMIGKKRSLNTEYVIEKQRLNIEIKDIFSKFVPLQILQNLQNNELEDRPPGDFAVEPVTMIYIDIRDFTNLSEGLTPEQNFSMINRFYEIVGYEVNRWGGFIESYGGDGVKAIFKDTPQNTINSALSISDEVALTSGLKIGMSIHFGKVVFGTIGGENRIQATAVSEVTRILGSMDGLNSAMGIEILITEQVYALSYISKDKILSLGRILLKDEEESLNFFQIIPKNFEIDPLFKEAFENGVKMIKYKNYPKAYGYFLLANRYNIKNSITIEYVKQLEKFFKLRELTFTLKV